MGAGMAKRQGSFPGSPEGGEHTRSLPAAVRCPSPPTHPLPVLLLPSSCLSPSLPPSLSPPLPCGSRKLAQTDERDSSVSLPLSLSSPSRHTHAPPLLLPALSAELFVWLSLRGGD
eukprot:scaffold118082_cov34-Tisochrysis_lutea.AAC.4